MNGSVCLGPISYVASDIDLGLLFLVIRDVRFMGHLETIAGLVTGVDCLMGCLDSMHIEHILGLNAYPTVTTFTPLISS